jgi:hypothetical protein
VRSNESKIEAVLEFLARWQTKHDGMLDSNLTGGQLADVRELERIYLLDDPTASQLNNRL